MKWMQKLNEFSKKKIYISKESNLSGIIFQKELTEVDVTTEEVQKEVDSLARECSVLATSLDSLQKLTRPQQFKLIGNYLHY